MVEEEGEASDEGAGEGETMRKAVRSSERGTAQRKDIRMELGRAVATRSSSPAEDCWMPASGPCA